MNSLADNNGTSANDQAMREHNAARTVINIAKYPVAAASGLLFAYRHARNAVYDLLKVRDADLKKYREEYHENISDAGSSFMSQEYERDKQFREFVKVRMEANGYKKPWDLVKGLGLHQRLDTAIAFASAASIAFGVALTIANNKELIARFTTPDQDAPQRS